jgi:type IV secretion system protein VirB6
MQNILQSAYNSLSGKVNLDAIKNLMSVDLDDVSKLIFFQRINEFMKEEIAEFGENLLTRVGGIIGGVALTLLTLWIMFQGFRIITGQSRDSMMALVVNSLKAGLIVGFALSWSVTTSSISKFINDDLPGSIYEMVTGNTGDVYKDIDRSLGYMQAAFSTIDAIQDGGDDKIDDQKSRAMWFTGIGTGGPAITAGVMMLLNRIAMALFIGFGPLFIMCLLFDQTKQLFTRWLFYGIATMFSLAVLSVMVTLAMDVVIAVAGSFWVGTLITGGKAEGVNSMAMQQGGLGLLLTMLIISAPPIAGNFFNGMMGTFAAYSSFGTFGGSTAPGTRGPNSPPVDNAAPRTNDRPDVVAPSQVLQPYQSGGGANTFATNEVKTAETARLGNAGVQQQALAQNTAQTVSPALQPPPGAGGPPRGGMG